MNMNIEQARHAMIEQQIRPWDVVDMQVLNTMQQVCLLYTSPSPRD